MYSIGFGLLAIFYYITAMVVHSVPAGIPSQQSSDLSSFFNQDSQPIPKWNDSHLQHPVNIHHRHGRSLFSSSSNNSELLVRCYGIYGCFSIGRPWTSSIRPINVFPESPDVIYPRYCLFTRQNPSTCQILQSGDVDSLRRSSISSSRRVLFIVHGYLENGNKKWIKRMVEEALIYEDINVIVVDWVAGSGPPYTQAVANIRLIGVMLAHFIIFLKDYKGILPENCHIAGHSLGSHLAGYAGQRLSEYGYRLGRITGLDPAEPYFENTEPMIRLDTTDALFVDVIHTDAGPIISGGLGLMQPSGHIDFYPNGGIRQPGCGESVLDSIEKEHGSVLYGLRRFLGCNHIRANEFFTDSFNSACPFLAVECPSWEDFRRGLCDCGRDGSSCFYMGYKANLLRPGTRSSLVGQPGPKKAFLATGSVKPFCLYHYRITVVISDTEESIQHGGDRGLLYVQLHGSLATSSVIRLTDEYEKFEPGKAYSFVMATSWLGSIHSATLEWHFSSSVFNPLTWRILTSPSVHVNKIIVDNFESNNSTEICGEDIALTSQQPRTMYPRQGCRPQTLIPIGGNELGNHVRRKGRKKAKNRRLHFWG